MTSQCGDQLLRDGKDMTMRSLPLESYWDEHPPRPYLRSTSTAAHRGYVATWEISDGDLYLIEFTAQAWKTSKDWIGNDALDTLWSEARVRGRETTVLTIIERLSNLPPTASRAVKRSAGIVLLLGQKLVSKGDLKPQDSGEEL